MPQILFTSFIFLVMSAPSFPSPIYQIPLKDIDGNPTNLSAYKGKVLLIVNVASKCGFTRQYSGLEDLYETYNPRGFVVLGFPCNQFAGQEPGDEQQIKQFCSTNFGVNFPLFAKIDVNGPSRHPLYNYIIGSDSPLKGSIKWNFNKILVDRDGKPVERYGSLTSPNSKKLRQSIERLLN